MPLCLLSLTIELQIKKMDTFFTATETGWGGDYISHTNATQPWLKQTYQISMHLGKDSNEWNGTRSPIKNLKDGQLVRLGSAVGRRLPEDRQVSVHKSAIVCFFFYT